MTHQDKQTQPMIRCPHCSDMALDSAQLRHHIALRHKTRIYTEADMVEMRKQTARDIFNLAHEYAQNDKTMVGSESLRDYHYYNAIHKIGEFDGR